MSNAASKALPFERGLGGAMPVYLSWLGLGTLLCFGVALLPGMLQGFVGELRWLLLGGLLVALGVYGVRAAQRGLLWRLRNKLILTYLLIGLAPVLLFLTLVFLCAYVAAGQFAVHLATSRMQEQVNRLTQENAGLARHAAVQWGAVASGVVADFPELRELNAGGGHGIQVGIFRDAEPLPVTGLSGHSRSPLPLTLWLQKLREGTFCGIVQDGTLLYLATVNRVTTPDGHRLTVLSSEPLDRERVTQVAQRLGRIDLMPGLEVQPQRTANDASLRQARLSGGVTPAAANAFDMRVRFFSSLPVQDWESGALQEVPLNVESRPSLLYAELFAPALSGRNTETVRVVLFAVCLLFALMEGMALWAAVRLSRTVTHSVEDLYAATMSIDRGELNHRIAVERDDQLADLCRSFNRMSWSLGMLIEGQKEKERIESELTIAQEVQANLFPLQSVSLPTLELHGICRPARTVSGDYYDFLPFEKELPGGGAELTGLGIALGDISGKGISAALLMATLHSAVRAYRFASEELLAPAALPGNGEQATECSELFESPGRILALLNRHLYRSTTPEKYATLFLAHYDRAASRLTYSNAGQLPPFILRASGTVERLDRGGTVVGLMDGMSYEEESLMLRAGDILVAYSDGVTEPENDFGEFGEDRMMGVVREFFAEPLEVISAEVMRALDAWIGEGEQPDDITLVLARQV